MDTKMILDELVESRRDETGRLMRDIWGFSELYFQESRSAQALSQALEKEGFSIETHLADIPTAFCATFGSEGPVIGFLGEYDALPALSQKAGCWHKEPVTDEDGAGHGCGHNCLGAGSFAAALALKEYLVKTGTKATVKYFGCPAEENGGGKVFMARAGVFEGLDAVFTWHPGTANYTMGVSSLAVVSAMYHFTGKATHASASPHLGRSALDAVELMNVGVNYLREHIIPQARVHYAYIDAGGKAPNVVQDHATVYYYVRAPKVCQDMEIFERVNDVARGAALMTGTEMRYEIVDSLADYVPNKTLSQLLNDSMQELGAPVFSQEELALAAHFSDTLTEEEKQACRESTALLAGVSPDIYQDQLMDDHLPDYLHQPGTVLPGSTDVGDVSYCAPTAQCQCATVAFGTGGHSWQMTAQGASDAALKGTLFAAKAMALAAAKAIEQPELLAQAKEEHRKNCPDGYICPLPADVRPHLE